MHTLLTRIRSVLFVVTYIGILIVMMILFLPILLLPRSVLIAVSKIWARIFAFLTWAIAGIRINIEGLEHVPEGGCIIGAKHQSTLDVFAMLGALKDPAFVLKLSLMRLPFFGWYAAKFRSVPVDRAKGKKALEAMIPPAREVIAQGRQLVIYPEGTRRPPGAPPRYKQGIAFVYKQTNVPVVPVALNTGCFWGRNSWTLQAGTTTIRFLPPIPAGKPPEEMMADLQAAIEAESDKLLNQVKSKA